MKSVSLKDVKEFEVKDIAEPEKNGKVIINVKRAGICGSDLHYWVEGNPKNLILGHEFCGVVTDPGVREDLKVGDRVTALPISPCLNCEACESGNYQYCKETWNHAEGLSLDNPGALAQKTELIPEMVIKLPDNVTDEEGAMVEPTAVGFHAVNLADVKVGNKVLVIGAGIIGLVSAMFAKKEGASYVAISETNEKRGKKAIELGVADEYFDAKDENFINKIMEKTNGGFDIVIECCGNSSAVSNALTSAKNGGKVVLVGVSMQPITIPSILAVMHELKIYGAIGYTKREFETCIDLIATKQIEILKFLDETIGLDGVQNAYERLTSGTDDAIKILVDPNK